MLFATFKKNTVSAKKLAHDKKLAPIFIRLGVHETKTF
jgi:hypothetical protein